MRWPSRRDRSCLFSDGIPVDSLTIIAKEIRHSLKTQFRRIKNKDNTPLPLPLDLILRSVEDLRFGATEIIVHD
jgi:hypothetical protein